MKDFIYDEKAEMKSLVRGCYDLQKLRIAMGNRIAINFKAKLGMDLKAKEAKAEKESKKVLELLRKSYDRITDGIIDMPTMKKFKGDELISTYAEMALIHGYLTILEDEKAIFKTFESALSVHPIYTEWLVNVHGCGPKMSGVIVSEIDIHKAKYPSSLHAYAGLDVGPDGRGRSRRKEHLVDVEYTDKKGEKQIKKGITFNPFLKTKLVGVLASSFIRCGEKSEYRLIYDAYKHRLKNHKKYKDASDGHRHNMAQRYMIKMFLIDLYEAWRKLEGLPVSEPYHVAKLGYSHGVQKAA